MSFVQTGAVEPGESTPGHTATELSEAGPPSPRPPGATEPVMVISVGNGAAHNEVAARVHDFDWSTTPLGPAEPWPQSLRAPVRILLTSRFAMWMGWGPELTFLYNDPYGRMTLGKKHSWALGRPARGCGQRSGGRSRPAASR